MSSSHKNSVSRDTRDTPKSADTAFNKHVNAVREALNNFNAISFLNAPGPTKIAMEELVDVTVRLSLF
jgi:hypothetical protein